MILTISLCLLCLVVGLIIGNAAGTDTGYSPMLAEKELHIMDRDHKIKELQHELEQSKQLKNVLEILATKTGIPTPDTKGGYLYAVDNGFGVSSTSWNTEIVLPDTVLQYTDDILGGKVIKQEGNKCLVIAKDGTVKTGLTKAKVDKGYTYKLVRE